MLIVCIFFSYKLIKTFCPDSFNKTPSESSPSEGDERRGLGSIQEQAGSDAPDAGRSTPSIEIEGSLSTADPFDVTTPCDGQPLSHKLPAPVTFLKSPSRSLSGRNMKKDSLDLSQSCCTRELTAAMMTSSQETASSSFLMTPAEPSNRRRASTPDGRNTPKELSKLNLHLPMPSFTSCELDTPSLLTTDDAKLHPGYADGKVVLTKRSSESGMASLLRSSCSEIPSASGGTGCTHIQVPLTAPVTKGGEGFRLVTKMNRKLRNCLKFAGSANAGSRSSRDESDGGRQRPLSAPEIEVVDLTSDVLLSAPVVQRMTYTEYFSLLVGMLGWLFEFCLLGINSLGVLSCRYLVLTTPIVIVVLLLSILFCTGCSIRCMQTSVAESTLLSFSFLAFTRVSRLSLFRFQVRRIRALISISGTKWHCLGASMI